jgi:hypothetical protein
VLRGRGGSDLFYGGTEGKNRIFGGTSGGRVGDLVEYGGEKAVRVNLSRGSGSGHGDDVLNGIEDVVSTAPDSKLVGNGKANLLVGGSGDDRISGRSGDDCLFPRGGDNVVRGGRGFDSFTVNAVTFCGTDSYAGSINPATSSGISVDLANGEASGEDGTTDLFGIEGAFGGPDADTLIGNDSDNAFGGAGGDDDIQGAGGDDSLDGGQDTDRLDGGAGTDDCQRGEIVVSCE